MDPGDKTLEVDFRVGDEDFELERPPAAALLLLRDMVAVERVLGTELRVKEEYCEPEE